MGAILSKSPPHTVPAPLSPADSPVPRRIHGEPGATYESAATRKFQRGRTETIRSCSAESLAFCRAMLEPQASAASKVEALKNAINAHKEYARDVSIGTRSEGGIH